MVVRDITIEDIKEVSNEKGVKVRTYKKIEDDPNPHFGGVFTYDCADMLTPSGYTIPLDEILLHNYNKGATVDLEGKAIKDKIKYARSIYDNPAEILRIDRKVKQVSADVIKAYVDIAKAGLEALLEKAGEDFSRGENSSSSKDRQRATAKYQKTLDLLDDLSKKIAEKFQSLKSNLEIEQVNSARQKEAAVKASIGAIFDEPQRGQ